MVKKRHAAHKGGQRPAKWRSETTGESQAKVPRGHFYITGINGVRECIRADHIKIKNLWADPGKIDRETYQMLAPQHKRLQEWTKPQTEYGPLTQGVAALIAAPEWPELDELVDTLYQEEKTPFLIALDQVEDIMNLGQILRTCACVGVHAVLVPDKRAAHMNQTVAQVSQGAFAWVPLLEIGNLAQTLASLKERGLWVAGFEADATSQMWHQVDFTAPTVMVFGSEGRGMRQLTRRHCDTMVALPMHGPINSLNVSATVAAATYEVARQRSL
jgi:23S rRNA (guanosine2251-2'-O)-methyltransferase